MIEKGDILEFFSSFLPFTFFSANKVDSFTPSPFFPSDMGDESQSFYTHSTSDASGNFLRPFLFLSSPSSTSSGSASSSNDFSYYPFYLTLGILLIGNMCLYYYLSNANLTRTVRSTPTRTPTTNTTATTTTTTTNTTTNNNNLHDLRTPRTPRHNNPQTIPTTSPFDSNNNNNNNNNNGMDSMNETRRRNELLSRRWRKEVRSACAGSIRSILTFILFEWTYRCVFYIQYFLEETIFFKGFKNIIDLYLMCFSRSLEREKISPSNDSEKYRTSSEQYNENHKKDAKDLSTSVLFPGKGEKHGYLSIIATAFQKKDNSLEQNQVQMSGKIKEKQNDITWSTDTKNEKQIYSEADNQYVAKGNTRAKEYDTMKFGHDIFLFSISRILKSLGFHGKSDGRDSETIISTEQVTNQNKGTNTLLLSPFRILCTDGGKTVVDDGGKGSDIVEGKNKEAGSVSASYSVETSSSFLSFFQNTEEAEENSKISKVTRKDNDRKPNYILTNSFQQNLSSQTEIKMKDSFGDKTSSTYSSSSAKKPTEKEIVGFKTIQGRMGEDVTLSNANIKRGNFLDQYKESGIEKDLSMLAASVIHWALCYSIVLLVSSIFVDVSSKKMSLSRSIYCHYRRFLFRLHLTCVFLIFYFVAHILYEHLQLFLVGFVLLLYGLSVANKGEVRNGNVLTFLISKYLWTSLSDWELSLRVGNIRIEMDLRL